MEFSMARKDIDKTPSIKSLIDLNGKVALVSGGTYGLGYAVAYRYLEAGAQVVITGRNETKGEIAVKELTDLGYTGKIAYARCDVRSVKDCYEAVDFTVSTFGRLDILANVAGWQKMYPALDMPEEVWDEMIDTNVKGTFFMSQAAARAMIRCGAEGYIVNTSSVSSRGSDCPLGMMSHYSASKGAVNALTLALGRELFANNIHVNAVACGGMNTEGKQTTVPVLAQTHAEFLGTMGDPKFNNLYAELPNSEIPDEMARMFLVLSTPFARHMLGETVFVDGGLRIYSRVVREQMSHFVNDDPELLASAGKNKYNTIANS